MGGLALPCQETRDCPMSRYGTGGVSESSDHQSWECGRRNREDASSPQPVNIVVRAQTNTVGETPATTCTAELIRKCLLRPGSANCFGPHRQPEICASRYGNDTLLPSRRLVAEVRVRIVRSSNIALTQRESQRASRGGTPFRFCRSYQRMSRRFPRHIGDHGLRRSDHSLFERNPSDAVGLANAVLDHIDRSTHPKTARIPAEAGILRGRAERI